MRPDLAIFVLTYQTSSIQGFQSRNSERSSRKVLNNQRDINASERPRYLVTGGLGFIGKALVEALNREQDCSILVVDNLHVQVHGPDASVPDLAGDSEVVVADIRDRAALAEAFETIEPTCVIHLAAETGTGQSQDEIYRYCDVNVSGTANVIECIRDSRASVRRLVLPSSRAVYGEGLYLSPDGQELVPAARSRDAMENGVFELFDESGQMLQPVPTHEKADIRPASIYGSTKFMQELLVQQASVTDPWEPVIFRFQNVYGPGQSLKNPYTGVLSIFCSQIIAGEKLNIYEDGQIVRDFVFVNDVIDAVLMACTPYSLPGIYNVGGGEATTIKHVADILLEIMGSQVDAQYISGDFRVGDIRHAVADIEHITRSMGWKPSISLRHGLEQLAKDVRISLNQ